MNKSNINTAIELAVMYIIISTTSNVPLKTFIICITSQMMPKPDETTPDKLDKALLTDDARELAKFGMDLKSDKQKN